MQRAGKEENVSNLVTWLHREATLRSRGKRYNDNADEKERTHRGPTFRRTDNHAANNDRTPEQEACPLGCMSKHQLAACPLYQSSTVNQRWDVVKQSKRCRKCLRPNHTNDCRKPDGTTCDKCKKEPPPFSSQREDELEFKPARSAFPNARYSCRKQYQLRHQPQERFQAHHWFMSCPKGQSYGLRWNAC